MGWSIAKLDRGAKGKEYIARIAEDVKRMRADPGGLDMRAYVAPESPNDPARVYFSPGLAVYASAFGAEPSSSPDLSKVECLF